MALGTVTDNADFGSLDEGKVGILVIVNVHCHVSVPWNDKNKTSGSGAGPGFWESVGGGDAIYGPARTVTACLVKARVAPEPC
jgi:hypothetical protein